MLEENIKFNLKKQEEIGSICAPLEVAFDIRFIHYRRFYLKGGLVSLFNHDSWMKISFDNSYWHSTVLQEKLQRLQHKSTLIYLWPSVPLSDPVYQGLYNCNLWNGVTIYKKYGDCIESYAFASSRQNTQAVNFYASEMQTLEHFILYFRSKAYQLLSPSVEQEIMIPLKIDCLQISQSAAIDNTFFQDTQIDHFYFRINGIDVKITKREEECLSLLAVGKTVKEIANALSLSPRTVETYIDHARLKTKACSTSGLINLYREMKC